MHEADTLLKARSPKRSKHWSTVNLQKELDGSKVNESANVGAANNRAEGSTISRLKREANRKECGKKKRVGEGGSGHHGRVK